MPRRNRCKPSCMGPPAPKTAAIRMTRFFHNSGFIRPTLGAPLGLACALMARLSVRRILASAYRTPPVRGEDRVHLRYLKNQCFNESPFRPLLRTPGTT
jgi:hypothetical protein